MSVFKLPPRELAAERARIAEREAAIPPTEIVISLADKAAGRGPELAARALRLGVPVYEERQETLAGRAICEFADGTSRESAIAAGRRKVGGF